MSPRIAHKKKVNFPNKEIRQMKRDLLKLRKFVEKNFDYVGDIFLGKLEKFIMIKRIKIFMVSISKRD